MEFKDFKEKYFGKSVEEIISGLKEEENFWKDAEYVSLAAGADVCATKILNRDKSFLAVFIFHKEYSIMEYIFQNLTTLELIPEDEDFGDYDEFVKQAILQTNSKAAFFYNMVEEIIKQKQLEVVNELYEVFKTGLPSTEDLKEIKTELGDVFSNESPEKLETIQNILAFNDPTMKEIKDIITTTSGSLS